MTDQLSRGARVLHHGDFDANELLVHKRDKNLTVSVVVPALDEAAHVGRVVATLRRVTAGASPLIDEVLVVDGGSEDATRQEARRAGAVVLGQADILPEHGDRPGKGEALWKGLAATSGDLVVFVDADIVDIGPRFIFGLLGPLLTDPAIAFVKAAYDRPLHLGDVLVHPTGGGRVTELMARPLLATFWPELSFLAQPLSGEYAGRREVLEAVPFITGYGVEIALLIDIAERFGADRIAQVDLDRRQHVHQQLPALGRMADEILHVALDRLVHSGRMTITSPLATVLTQHERTADSLVETTHHVRVGQRPPLAQLR